MEERKKDVVMDSAAEQFAEILLRQIQEKETTKKQEGEIKPVDDLI